MSRPAPNRPAFPAAEPHKHKDASDELLGPMARLRLMGYGPANGRDPFVGGFTRPPASSSSASSPGRDKPLPPPPPMPQPAPYTTASVNAMYPIPPLPEPPRMYFSPPQPVLAVEALLAQPAPPHGPWRPFTHSASAPPPTVAPALATPQRRRSSSSATAAGLVLPSSASPARGGSVPPVTGSDPNQCSATTKAGKRCANKVKAGLPLTYIDGTPEELERYCHIHLKEALQPTGFYSRKQKSVWVEFEKWIPDWLSAETKAALRSEMEKAASSSDADGYIYTFELRQPALSADVHLKVGRTNNVGRRLHEWGKQCGKEVVPRGLWPAPADEGASMLVGRIRPGQPGPFVSRLERLIHLELADLAVMAPYLPEKDRPKLLQRPPNRRSSSDGTGTSAKKSPAKPPPRPRILCACGRMHQEIFMFSRARSGKYKDHIWDELVQPVIERWGKFVDEHVALPATS